ncbi:MAG: hypothetical protein ACYDC3_02805 [Candidatus Binataceae bacterium]
MGVTLVYMLISLGLLLATKRQARLAEEALTETQKSADAAKQSAEAATKSAETAAHALKGDRPYLVVDAVTVTGISPRPAKNGSGGLTDSDLRGPLGFIVKIRNAGNETAVIEKAVARLTLKHKHDWPSVGDFKDCQSQAIDRGAVTAVDAFAFQVIRDLNEALNLSWGEFDEMAKGAVRLVCYGRLDYRDVAGQQYCTEFCWEFVPWPYVMVAMTGSEWQGQGSTRRGPDENNRYK